MSAMYTDALEKINKNIQKKYEYRYINIEETASFTNDL